MSEKSIQAKAEVVASLVEKFKRAKGIVLVDYSKMTVAEDTALRNEMRKNGVEYKVIKNRIMLRAFEQAGYKGLESILAEMTAVAISYDDPVTPAKILADNAKKLNKTKLKGGIIEGSVMDENAIKAVAAIPPKPVLVAQLLGLLTSPMRSLAVGLSEVAKKQSA